MKRIIGALASSAAIGLAVTGVASAAATPVVTTGNATNITTTTAVLHGQINPRGIATDYSFNYGPTAAYGSVTVARSAGSGRRSLAVQEAVTGLLPGTVYHYQIEGVSPSGQVTGADGTFTTAGVPPSTVATGPAVGVGKTVATPTGTIDPNGSQTTWVIEYGLTTSYGLQTSTQAPIAPGFAAVPVSAALSGLAPATLFHYRIVAYHGTTETDGADGTFFTEPDRAPSPKLTTKTSPGADKRAPYTFTTSGSLRGGTYIPIAQRCTGTVGIRYFNGSHQLAYVVADVSSDCTFSDQASFRKTDGKGAVPIRVSVYYRGNGYLAAQRVTDHVHAGR